MDKIKIKSSFLIISGYEFKIAAEKQIELSSEFLMLPVDTGRETILASLSFKHVINVEVYFSFLFSSCLKLVNG